jgi:uroporphyrin-III C-methyltransferase
VTSGGVTSGGVTSGGATSGGVTSGRVWLVGAGPGDPELITVRGRRLLERAQAVVHDRLVSQGLLDLIPPGVLRVDVGKTGYEPAIAQADINATLISLARQGLAVVRLKGGDPFIFGRGGEELEALRDAGVPVEVVPGVTAGIAGPALAGIPPTHRGLARSVAFVTATSAEAGKASQRDETTADGEGRPPDWHALAAIDTLVVYMAGRAGSSVARHLLEAGRSPTTPVAVLRDASLPSHDVRVSDLASLAAMRSPAAWDGRAALLVVGDVVALRTQSAPG